jgi:hypothetical protein
LLPKRNRTRHPQNGRYSCLVMSVDILSDLRRPLGLALALVWWR